MRRFFYVFGTVILIGLLIGSCASAPEQADKPEDREVTQDGEKELSAEKGRPAEEVEALLDQDRSWTVTVTDSLNLWKWVYLPELPGTARACPLGGRFRQAQTAGRREG